MKLSPGTDVEMLEALSISDRLEEEVDDKALGVVEDQLTPMEPPPSKERPPTKTVTIQPARTKKAEVSDNWNDNLSDDEKDDSVSQTGDRGPGTNGSTGTSSTLDTDAVLGGKGLLQVLQTFKMLQAEFNQKFKAMWA